MRLWFVLCVFSGHFWTLATYAVFAVGWEMGERDPYLFEVGAGALGALAGMALWALVAYLLERLANLFRRVRVVVPGRAG